MKCICDPAFQNESGGNEDCLIMAYFRRELLLLLFFWGGGGGGVGSAKLKWFRNHIHAQTMFINVINRHLLVAKDCTMKTLFANFSE